MKVVYLDFDGVLHHENVVLSYKHPIVMQTPGHALFEWMPILEALLQPHPEVKIVLSTSWVWHRSFDFARAQLTPALQERVVGATYHRRHHPRRDFRLTPRGEQIAEDVFRRRPSAWFALDDDTWGWPGWCRDNLIATQGGTGVSDPRIQHAIATMLARF